MWSFEMMVLLSGLLPNPKLEASVLSIWLVSITVSYLTFLSLQYFYVEDKTRNAVSNTL